MSESLPLAPRIPAPSAPPKAGRRWWILGIVGLVQLMVVLDATIVNIALPSAQRALDFSDADRQWVVTAYSLAFGSLLLLGGRLSDLIGRKPALLVGLLGFAAASAIAGAAGSLGVLISARAVQGAFGALLAPVGLAVLTATFTDPRERQRAFGIWAGIAGAGGAVGLLLGGLLTQDLSWRWNLYVNVVIALVALAGALLFLPRQGRATPRPHLDVPGTLLVGGGLFSLVFGFSNSVRDGWAAPETWGFLIASGVLLLLFGLRQATTANPLLPLGILFDRTRGPAFLAFLLCGACSLSLFFFLSYFLQIQLRYSPIETGLAFLPLIVALVFASALSSNRLAPRLGPKVLVPGALAVIALGMAYLARISLTSTYSANVLPGLLVVGLGVGAAFGAGVSYLTQGIDPRYAGVGSSLLSTSQQVGGSVGTALLNTIAASTVTAYLARHRPPTEVVLAQAQVSSYSVAFWWAAGALLAGALVTAVLFPRRPVPPAVDADEPPLRVPRSRRRDAPLEVAPEAVES